MHTFINPSSGIDISLNALANKLLSEPALDVEDSNLSTAIFSTCCIASLFLATKDMAPIRSAAEEEPALSPIADSNASIGSTPKTSEATFAKLAKR